MSEKMKAGGPNVTGEGYNPNVGHKKEVPHSQENRRSRIGALSAAALAFIATTVIPNNTSTPNDVGSTIGEGTGTDSLTKTVDTDAAKEKEKLAKALVMLREAEELLRSNRLAEEVPMFRAVPEPNSKEACTFLDNWYNPQKSNLNDLWVYAQARHDRWNPDLKSSMSAALEVSKVAAEALNWKVIPKKYHAPTTLEELYERLNTKLSIPADSETTCGFFFDKGYGYMQSKNQASNIQKLFRNMILGFSVLISQELEAYAPGERNEDYAAAEKLAQVVKALVPETK